jgi:uncharacterized membrane protein
MHVETLLIIFGMGLITYGTRAGGVWLMSRIKPSPFVEAWIRHIPGAVLVAIVAPAALTNGAADALGALTAALVAMRSRNMMLTIAVGITAVVFLRRLLPA